MSPITLIYVLQVLASLPPGRPDIHSNHHSINPQFEDSEPSETFQLGAKGEYKAAERSAFPGNLPLHSTRHAMEIMFRFGHLDNRSLSYQNFIHDAWWKQLSWRKMAGGHVKAER
jgi:hypothetical protein